MSTNQVPCSPSDSPVLLGDTEPSPEDVDTEALSSSDSEATTLGNEELDSQATTLGLGDEDDTPQVTFDATEPPSVSRDEASVQPRKMECEPTSRSEEPKHQLLKPSEEAAEPFGAGSCDDPCAAVLSSLRDFGMSQLAPHAALALERARDEGHEREEDLVSAALNFLMENGDNLGKQEV